MNIRSIFSVTEMNVHFCCMYKRYPQPDQQVAAREGGEGLVTIGHRTG